MDEAALVAWRAWERFAGSATPLAAAYALTELHDAMNDLATWLPGFDSRTGTVPEDEGAVAS